MQRNISTLVWLGGSLCPSLCPSVILRFVIADNARVSRASLDSDHDRESRSSRSLLCHRLRALFIRKGNFRYATLEMQDRRPAIERLTDDQAWRRVTTANYTANLRHRGNAERFDLAVLQASGRARGVSFHSRIQSRETLLGSPKLPGRTLPIAVLSFRPRTSIIDSTRAAIVACAETNGTSYPDARASELDLLVPRSSRIAANSSYFALI